MARPISPGVQQQVAELPVAPERAVLHNPVPHGGFFKSQCLVAIG